VSGPIITIYVRHSADCRYKDDEFCKRCNCRKHLRYTLNGKQFRVKAGTRSWEGAEAEKRRREDQLAGRKPTDNGGKPIDEAVKVFIQDKKNQGLTAKVIDKYTRELDRFHDYCIRERAHTVQAITSELLTGYAATWIDDYPASLTRSKVRERLRSFLRYCYQAEWLTRVPQVSKVKVEQDPTMPLTAKEYETLLDTCYATFADDKKKCDRVHALLQLIRWSGLAIRDALTIQRAEIIHDEKKGLYRVVTSRQKTGTHVSVPIPKDVAQELLTVLNGNSTYVFWSGNGMEESATKNWAKHIAKVFEDAGIPKVCYMVSHRLRDTFAVDLLEKGVPLEEVSKLLGHTSIKTTERHYAKWVKGRQDRLDSLVSATW
jgi:site-specific recombinase XerD